VGRSSTFSDEFLVRFEVVGSPGKMLGMVWHFQICLVIKYSDHWSISILWRTRDIGRKRHDRLRSTSRIGDLPWLSRLSGDLKFDLGTLGHSSLIKIYQHWESWHCPRHLPNRFRTTSPELSKS
jgi:hypothetical protein